MNTIVEHINSAGFSFVEFALPMLIQSSVLIVILLLVDLLLRKKVKAVFRYWIWMLVLLKLILPTSLSSPLSLGYLFGEKLTYQDLAQTSATLEPTEPAPADISPGIEPLFIQPNPYIPPTEPVISVFEPAIAEPVSPPEVPVTPLSWQGVVFLVWLVVVIAMGLLLLQRALFVRGLVAQSKKAGRLMNDALAYCCASMRIKCKVGLKISVNATTPSVCGLIRPVILVPWNLASTLGASRLRTILMHELAHIKRGDLWVNLVQTALQIIYFYNPLFWLANCVIRRVREQAVDEAVLVAMGEKAQKYPQTLVDVAKMAFKRPALSLRLIGVVESKSALAGRIKHILGRPMPKTARLGIVGVLAVIIAGAILLPMAAARQRDGWVDKDLLDKLADSKVNAEGQQILKQMAEVNQYWLVGPPSEVRDYSYDFNFHDEKESKAQRIKVSYPVWTKSSLWQGITYDSVLHKLTADPAAAVIHEIKRSEQTIRLDFVLKEFIKITCGNGVQHSWRGYFTGPVKAGSLWMDAEKMVPLKVKAGLEKECFSDYVAINDGHYVPLTVKIDHGHMHFDWMFCLYEPGLWLFDNSLYPRDNNDTTTPVASISNVRVNAASAVKLRREPLEIDVESLREVDEARSSEDEKEVRFFNLILCKNMMEFEGQAVTWDTLASVLAKVPDRYNAGLQLVVGSDELSSEELSDAKTRISMLTWELGFGYSNRISRYPVGSKDRPTVYFFTAPLKFNKEIAVGLHSGTEFNQQLYREQGKWLRDEAGRHKVWATIGASSIRFKKPWLRDQVEANLKVRYDSWPKAKWEFAVRLLDKKGNKVAQATSELDTGGHILSGRVFMMWSELDFSLGRKRDISKAATFEITIVPLLENDSIPNSQVTNPTEKTDVHVGMEETISPKLVMLLRAINSCAAETKLNIESISIKLRGIDIKGDTSSRINSQKFLDAIRKNGLDILRLSLDTRGNRDRFSMIVEPKKDWQQWWRQHKTDIEADFPTKEDVVSKPPQPEFLSATPPIFAYDVELNFADPTVRDGTFHSEQSVAFSLSFHNIEIPPAGKLTLGHLLIGQTTWPVHLEDNGITIKEGVAGQKVLSLTWPAGESEFEKVIKIPVKYGQKEYSCPVRVELDRRAEGAPIGSYWFCAYLSGRLPWGAGGSRFEIVNLDQQMEFRLTGDGSDPRDAVLGIDINGDGKIDPAKTGGEQFDLYEPFQIGPKTYRLTEVDPYLPRVVFREVDAIMLRDSLAKTCVPVEEGKGWGKVAEGAPIYNKTIRFTGVVTKIMEFNPSGNHETFAVEDDPRFILFLQVNAADPQNYWFQPGRDVDFLIHDPVVLFGGEQKEVVGKSYYFVMERHEFVMGGDMERRFTLLSVKPLAAEPKPDVPVEGEGFGQKHEDEQGNAYLDAIIGGDLRTVQKLLANDPGLISMIDNKRGKESSGLPALHLAIKYGHSGIVELLLSKGAKADEMNVWGYGSLLVAARNGRANLVKLLVDYGADVNGEKNKFRHPPLRAASNAQVAEALIANGADVNWRDERRATPLHSIARLGITTIAEVLVAHGADINAKDNAAWTPLNIAAGRGQKDMVELLITKGADINAKDKRGSTPLHRAITAEPTVPKAGRKATVEFLLARGADFTIHDVAWVGDVARVRKLLESNPSLARNANRALFAAIREGHSTIVELLLDNGAKLSTKGRFKEPPLHAAAYSGHRDMAALLLRKGADVNRKGAHGELALHWAAAKGHGEITRLLVEAGAEVNTHTDTTRADVDVLPAGDDADVIHEQLRYLTDCEKQEQAMAAGSSLQIMGLRRLVFAAGDTALHSAAQWGHKEISQLLLANGADVNATNRLGQTPLHYAVVFQHDNVVKALLNAGADPNVKTLDGSTAHDLASIVKDTELADMLRIEQNMISPAGETEDESKISELLTVLEDGRYANIRQRIMLMVDEIGDKEPISFLYEQLKSKDRERRSNAALALQLLGETPCVEGLCHNVELIKNELAFGQGPELVFSLTNTTAEPIDVIGFQSNSHSDQYLYPCAQLTISQVGSKHYGISSYDFGTKPKAVRIAPGKSWSFRIPSPKMKESTTTEEHHSSLPNLWALPPGKYTARVTYFIRESEIEKFGPGLVFWTQMGSLAGKKPDRLWRGVIMSKELVFEVLDDDSEQLRIRKAIDSGEGLENVEFELKASKAKVLLLLSAKNTGAKTLYLGGHYCLRGKGMGNTSLFGSGPMELKPGVTLELGGWNLNSIGPGTYWVEYLSNFPTERVLKKSNTVTFEVTKPAVHVEIDDRKEVPADRLIVPGRGVGDCKFGMSKDDVLKSLRKTKGDSLRVAENSISVDGVILKFIDDSVNSIDVLSPLYRFANGLGIGSSEQQIIQAFGNDFHLKEYEGKDFLTYKDKGLVFEIYKYKRTVMEMSVLKTADSLNPSRKTDVQVEVGETVAVSSESEIKPATTETRSGSELEFRIAPEHVLSSRAPSPLTIEEIDRYKRDLAENGPLASRARGGEFAWFQIKSGANVNSLLVSGEYQGGKYLLLYNREPFVMLPRQGWRLVKAAPIKDAAGRVGIQFELDQKGAELLYALSNANVGRALAIVVDDAVVAVPATRAAIRNKGIIKGNFTEQEVNEIVTALRRGMLAGEKSDPTLDVAASAAAFEELSVKFGGIWMHWQDVEFTVKGDGSVAFSMNKGPSDKTKYKTAFKLSGAYLAQLSGLLRKTNWLTAPGANVQPGFSDATRIDISLTREDKVQNVWCHDRNAEPYLSLIIFLKRIQRQEYLLYQMTVPGSLDRHSAFSDVYQQIRAEKGEPVTAYQHRILDFSRFVPALIDVITHPDDNHYEKVATAARSLGKLRVEKVREKITDLTTAERKKHYDTAAVIRTERIRAAAVEALTELGGEQARLHIRDMAKNHRSWRRETNDALVESLLELDRDNCVQLLKDMTSTTKEASWGLIRLRPAALPAIVEILEARDTKYTRQIDLIRQYIKHWQEVTKPIDTRVIEAVQKNLDYRLGRGPGWTQYHKEFLQLAGAPELPGKDARQIAEEFLAAVKINDQMKIDAIARTGSGNWPQRLAKLRELPKLQQLEITEVYVDDNLAWAVAAATGLGNENSDGARIALNFLSGSVWRVANIRIETPEIAERMRKRYLENHPNARPVPARESSGPAVKTGVPVETRGGISGIVVNSATGKPITGAYVGVGDFGDSGGSNYSRHRSQGFHDKTKTDAEGRFELNGLVFTDKHRDLEYHPLIITHPDFVRHDEKIELPSSGPAPDVKVSLRPAAKIDLTIVDADGNPLQGQWLLRLEALDGRRFIPPGSDPHLSSFASSIWEQMPNLRSNMGVSNGFTFTELDSGRYSIEAIRFYLVDKPTPQNIWKPTITYHGSIPNLKIEAGQTKQVRLAPQDHQTRLTIIPPEFPDKLMDKLKRSTQMPLMCLISRSPGAMLWDDGKIRHLEDERLGRIDKTRFFRGFFSQGQPLTINNLPPDSYSLFAMVVYGQVAGCLIGARAELAKGDDITVEIPWRQPTGPSMVGPNRSFDYPVKLGARDYSVSRLCEILTSITQSNPRIIADPSIENEKLRFGKGQMSVWDVLEKLYLDREWTVDEGAEKTLIIKPAEQTDVPVEGKGTEAVSTESEVKPAASEDGPRITFESLVCDLGQVAPRTKHSCEFRFTNTGSALLKITRVHSACACAASKLKKKEYAPGESGTLKVTYQSAAHAGRVTKHVYVYSNDTVNQKVTLTIKAEIVIKVAHEPKRLSLVLDKENAGCPAIKLTSIDNQPFSITGFKSTGDSLKADFDPSSKETSFVIQPKVDVEKLRKGLMGSIEISLTHPECKTLMMIYQALPEFKFDPRVVSVRDAEARKPVTKTIRVLSNYNQDVEIESTSSKKGTVKVLTQEKVRNGRQLELEITPPAAFDTKRRVFTDVFTVVLKGGRKLNMTCYGVYSRKSAKTKKESVPKTDAPVEGKGTGASSVTPAWKPFPYKQVEESLGEARVVHFPVDRSLGKLCVQRETIGTPSHWWWGLHSQWQYLRSQWQYLAEARGDVTVPAGKRLGFIVGRDGRKALTHLAKLRPDDLYMLKIKCGKNAVDKPGDDSMPHLSRLTGLKELILEYPGITNEGLRPIKGLSSLERLSLISKQLDDTGMAHIAELKSLKGLRFSSRNVTNAGLSHLSKLTLLEEMFPSGIIDDEGLVHLTRLPALRYLHMYSVTGGFTENGLVHLKNIPSLKKLELGSFGFSGEGLAHISRIPGIEDLTLYNTVLSDEDLIPLKSMNSLKRLSLSPAIQQMAPDFTDEALFHLNQVKSLESLVLGYGKFTDKGLEYLTELDNLKHLDIPNNSGFTDAGLSHLTKLPLLEELKLRANQFTDVGMSSISKLTNLKRLELWGHRANITDKGLSHLADMSRLSYLVIKGNFDDEGLAHVGNLNKLSYLDISGDFTDEKLHHLEGLDLLKQLKISSRSKLSPQALQELRGKLPNLLVLN